MFDIVIIDVRQRKICYLNLIHNNRKSFFPL